MTTQLKGTSHNPYIPYTQFPSIDLEERIKKLETEVEKLSTRELATRIATLEDRVAWLSNESFYRIQRLERGQRDANNQIYSLQKNAIRTNCDSKKLLQMSCRQQGTEKTVSLIHQLLERSTERIDEIERLMKSTEKS